VTPKEILELSMGKLTSIFEFFIGVFKDIYGLLLENMRLCPEIQVAQKLFLDNEFFVCLFLVGQPPMGLGLLIKRSLDNIKRGITVGRTPLDK